MFFSRIITCTCASVIISFLSLNCKTSTPRSSDIRSAKSQIQNSFGADLGKHLQTVDKNLAADFWNSWTQPESFVEKTKGSLDQSQLAQKLAEFAAANQAWLKSACLTIDMQTSTKTFVNFSALRVDGTYDPGKLLQDPGNYIACEGTQLLSVADILKANVVLSLTKPPEIVRPLGEKANVKGKEYRVTADHKVEIVEVDNTSQDIQVILLKAAINLDVADTRYSNVAYLDFYFAGNYLVPLATYGISKALVIPVMKVTAPFASGSAQFFDFGEILLQHLPETVTLYSGTSKSIVEKVANYASTRDSTILDGLGHGGIAKFLPHRVHQYFAYEEYGALERRPSLYYERIPNGAFHFTADSTFPEFFKENNGFMITGVSRETLLDFYHSGGVWINVYSQKPDVTETQFLRTGHLENNNTSRGEILANAVDCNNQKLLDVSKNNYVPKNLALELMNSRPSGMFLAHEIIVGGAQARNAIFGGLNSSKLVVLHGDTTVSGCPRSATPM